VIGQGRVRDSLSFTPSFYSIRKGQVGALSPRRESDCETGKGAGVKDGNKRFASLRPTPARSLRMPLSSGEKGACFVCLGVRRGHFPNGVS
jgi:hypothetical protein